jgi:hypothetical protein
MPLKIARDKWNHFFAGILMGMFVQLFLWTFFPLRHVLATILSFSVVVIVSYGFELFSLITGKGHYEFSDAVAAIAGGLVGIGVGLICIAI